MGMTVMEWLKWKYRGYLAGGQRYLRGCLDRLPKTDGEPLEQRSGPLDVESLPDP